MSEKEIKGIIPGPIDLAKETWGIYKSRFWTIIGISALGMLVSIVIAFTLGVLGFLSYLGLGAKISLTILGLGALLFIILFLLMTVLWSWAGAANIMAVSKWKSDFGIKDALREGKKFIVPMFLTSLLYSFISLGSFLFFIIPAFIFGVWFIFWQYFVVLEDRSLFNALHASRESVRGRFWGILWRLIAIHLPEIVLSILLGRTSRDGSGPANGGLQLVSLILQPFYFAYTYTLFSHVKKTTKDLPQIVPQANKVLYLLISLLGFIIIIIAGILVVPTAVKTLAAFGQAAMQEQQITSPKELQASTRIANGLIMYYLTNKKFPKTLEEIKDEKTLITIPSEASTGLPYRYTQLKNGQDFQLCTPVSVKPEKCVTAASSDFNL